MGSISASRQQRNKTIRGFMVGPIRDRGSTVLSFNLPAQVSLHQKSLWNINGV